MTLTGALLVGGASERFGSPKALARLGEETLAERGWRVLNAACDEVIAVGKTADGLVCPSRSSMMERVSGAPVFGVLAGLRAARNDVVVFLPVDCPRMTPAALRCLGEGVAERHRSTTRGARAVDRRRGGPTQTRHLSIMAVQEPVRENPHGHRPPRRPGVRATSATIAPTHLPSSAPTRDA